MEQPPTRRSADEAARQPQTTPGPLASPFPVVGLGASAGGLEALQAFFDHTPPDIGMAFVVILHLSPEYESQAAALLQARTAMPVTQVTDAVSLAPNHVYVIPPARHLLIADGRLHVADPPSEQGRRVPIDHFFRALADTHDSRAVAIILSGTGSDGSVGLKRIKEHGGAIFVQEPREAEFDGMPRSAIATGLVDFVLPVATMPEMLIAYCHRAAQLELPAPDAAGTVDDEAALRDILALVRVRTNHDFSQYKRPTVLRRAGRRMQVMGVTDLPAYLELLRGRADEVEALLQDLLISVTNFFRDREAWAALEAIIPLLFAGRGPGDQVRVWVTACATGEEAYSVAMLLEEHARTLDHPPAIQVFATDIDDAAIRHARVGSYPETIAGDVDLERLRQFFVWEQGRYRVKQELRDLVLFAHHNVLRDPPFSKLDLITCRNLLIYLNYKAQEQVLRLFHFSLRPGGYLLLGSAESLDSVPQLFEIVAEGQRLFRQRAVSPVVPPPLASRTTTTLPLLAAAPGRVRAAAPGLLADLHQRLLLQHAPPSAIVNEDYEIVHLSRGAGRFLRLEEGEPSVNLLRAAHPDLRLELRTALLRAAQGGLRAESRRVRVAFDEAARLVDLVVEPVQDADWPRGYLFVLFDDVGAAGDGAGGAAPAVSESLREIEAELQRTRAQLQTTAEEYETAGEEYKAANEELQAINEELRAASEELETSKEELQAINEELTTVNQELKHKVAEVTRANDDLQNLIAATQIGTIFLDRDLRITRYTPSAQRIFNLIPTDLHRPLAHITHTLQYERLAADAGEVLAALQPIAREVKSTAGHWYFAQLRPYRTIDDRIAGVVITFVDITERKLAEEALHEARQDLEVVLEAAEMGVWDTDLTTGRARTSPRHNQIFGYTEPVAAWGTEVFREHILPEDHATFEQSVARAMETGVLDLQVRVRWPDGSVHWIYDRGRVYYDEQRRPLHMAGVTLDITERKRGEEALRESEERYRTLFDSIDEGFCIIEMLFDERGQPNDFRYLEVNPAFAEQTGLVQVEGRRVRELLRTLDERWFHMYGQVALTGEPVRFQHTVEELQRWFDVYAFRVDEPERRKVGVLFTNITEPRQAAAERERLFQEAEQARQEAEAALEVRNQFLSIASHELRTPLTPLMGYVGMLRQSLARIPDEPYRRLIDTIERQTKRLNTLIDTLLDVARLQRGQFALEPRPLDLVTLAAQVVDEFRLTLPAEGANHTITLLGPDEPVPVFGDLSRLEEILHNLLSNAVKYSPGGGTIHVRVARQAGESLLEVADEGIGIPAEAQAHLFEPFYRARNVGALVSGFGLGLYIVQEIVQRHGGRVEVESAEGQGTTLRITLPLSGDVSEAGAGS